MNKRVLIIGGGGYIGSVLTKFFINQSYFVRCLDCFIAKQPLRATFPRDVRFDYQFGDICDPRSLDRALET